MACCRYHTIARIIRQGYNVLSVHADSHFSDDPYVYAKRPPLNKAALVTMSHGGWTGLTSGFLYIQNAEIAGPVSWIFTETVDRVRTQHGVRACASHSQTPHKTAVASVAKYRQ